MRIGIFIRRTYLSLLFILLSGTSAHALDVNRRVLDNGLIVLHVERHNLPIVKVSLLVRASPLDESIEGVSNLTAALLTEGTKKRTAAQISDEIEFVGAGLGASDGSDFTTLSLSVLKKDLHTGFDVFSDILLNPSFPDEEIKRQKELIKGSLRRSEDEPTFLANREFRKAVFGEHPYGRLVSGSAEAVDKIEREDIVRFYEDYFRPNNSILSVTGDLTPAELEGLISEYLSGWKEGPPPPRKTTAPPVPARSVIKIDRDLKQATVLMGHIGVRRDDPDYYALSIMNYILGGGGFSSRLMASIRDDMGLAYDVHSFFTSNKEPGLFRVGVQTKNASANAVISEIIRQIKLIREKEVSDGELDDAKSYLTGSFPRRLDTMAKISGFLAQVEFFGLGLDYPDKYPGLINSVTKADIMRVARKYLRPDDYVLVVVAKQSEADIKEPAGE